MKALVYCSGWESRGETAQGTTSHMKLGVFFYSSEGCFNFTCTVAIEENQFAEDHQQVYSM